MLESLYAVQYGKGFKYGGPDFSFLFYVAKVKGKWVLIDTGFSSQELAMAMGITMIPVKNEMKAIGMPGQILTGRKSKLSYAYNPFGDEVARHLYLRRSGWSC